MVARIRAGDFVSRGVECNAPAANYFGRLKQNISRHRLKFIYRTTEYLSPSVTTGPV